MDRLQSSFMSIEQVKDIYLGTNKSVNWQKISNEQNTSFQKILEETTEKNPSVTEVTFSKHANDRLESRNISLDDEQLNRLSRGVMQAKEKNINESLVMMDDIAFIVNIKNSTVITAMDQKTNDNNVFTNIDGAVIV